MLNIKSASPIKLTCKELGLAEFPDLLFGNTSDSTYFDATDYLQKKDPTLTVPDFLKQYENQILSLMQTYNMKDSDVCKINSAGHFLIESNFVYLFISFVEQDFLAYMCERIHELFTDGFCVSDTYILKAADSRLTPEILNTIKSDGMEK